MIYWLQIYEGSEHEPETVKDFLSAPVNPMLDELTKKIDLVWFLSHGVILTVLNILLLGVVVELKDQWKKRRAS